MFMFPILRNRLLSIRSALSINFGQIYLENSPINLAFSITTTGRNLSGPFYLFYDRKTRPNQIISIYI